MASSRPDATTRQGRSRPTLILFDSVSLLIESLVCALQAAEAAIHFECRQDALDCLADTAGPPASLLVLCPQGQGAGVASLVDRVASLRAVHPSIPFAVLSEAEEIDEIGRALAAGACGVISTSLSLPVVLSALRLMLTGGTYVPPLKLLSGYQTADGRPQPEKSWHSGLSPREASVARALKSGTPNKIIAAELGIGESAVKLLVRRLMRKFKAKNRTEVAYLMNNVHLE